LKPWPRTKELAAARAELATREAELADIPTRRVAAIAAGDAAQLVATRQREERLEALITATRSRVRQLSIEEFVHDLAELSAQLQVIRSERARAVAEAEEAQRYQMVVEQAASRMHSRVSALTSRLKNERRSLDRQLVMAGSRD
jgi:hypothetical protein